jgi:flagellar biosynthesis/type III secretory pathway M-ring protein FliF/YscJ|tara:strand:+ start:330 stop:530 length:201 start_codon:yes stop_codon:yes gene_type:complete
MIIRGMNLPLIIACTIIVLALIIFPLIVSHKAEKNDNLKSEEENKLSEWEKIKKYGEKINKKNRDK